MKGWKISGAIAMTGVKMAGLFSGLEIGLLVSNVAAAGSKAVKQGRLVSHFKRRNGQTLGQVI